jgi:hydroxymethylpyrimidine pyrophosphatase-like HAD family hydrolase
MKYIALATDYDGTLAHDGVVDEPTLAALRSLKQSGRKLILVTGRELADLESVFSHFALFDLMVAENGAVVYNPATNQKQVLSEPPPPAFVRALKQRGVAPISTGDSIVATRRPNETAVLEVIRDLGLELQVIFNKKSVMILPATVNKLSGLKVALGILGISEQHVVGVGDAENDHAFLKACGFSVAVANALPSLKETANFTTHADHGAGVVELIGMILEDDLAAQDHRLAAEHRDLGEDASFYFRGPLKKLNLRAQNLALFLQLADGVDDDTWLYHLKCGDYSRWFRRGIQDSSLAEEAAEIERNDGSPKTSRQRIRQAIERRHAPRPDITRRRDRV